MTDGPTTTDLSAWFSDRPKWLQEAADLLLMKGRLPNEDIDALFGKCLREVESKDMEKAPSIPANAFHAQSPSELRLCTIGNVKGINALAPSSPLDFGSGNMAVV